MNSMFASLDGDKSGTVTFQEVLSILYPLAKKSDLEKMLAYTRAKPKKKDVVKKFTLTKEQEDEMGELFEMYDTDKSGSLSVRELTAAMTATGTFTREEVERIFEAADDDQSNEMDLAEFKAAFREAFYDTDYQGKKKRVHSSRY